VKIFNVIVVGCGRIGKMHVENLLAYFPNVTVQAIVDDNVDSEWAKSLGIPNILQSDQLDAALSDPSIDAVIIAASSSEHVNLIQRVAQAGKNMFCEKPIGFTPETIQVAINAVEQAGVILQVGFNRRFDPDFSRIQQTVAHGEVGLPHIVKITNRDPRRPDLKFIPRSGGLFLDFNVHDFDTARFVTQQEVKEVFVMGAVLVDPKIGELGDIDTATISLKMDKGTFCIIDTSREAVYGYDQRLEVFGSEGSIAADNETETRTQLSTADAVFSETCLYSFVERYQEAYRLQFEAFFATLAAKSSAVVGANDAKQAVAIAVAASESLRTNRPVSLK